MTRVMTIGAIAMAGMALMTSACGGVTREEALEELESAGYAPTSAECIMSSIESQGFDAADLEDPIEPEVETAIQVGVEECITSDDVAGLTDNVGADELRANVIDDLVQGGMDPGQAECIIAEVEGAGYTVVDLAQAGLEGQTEGGVIDVIADATLGCTGG